MRRCRLAVLLLLLMTPAFSQRRVASSQIYDRVLCVVPMVGAGTFDDPRRPLFAPVPTARRQGPPFLPAPEIVGFTYEVSDDGLFALVEFVARDRRALDAILSDTRPNIKVFRKGQAKREDIEKEFRKHKKNFDITRFGVVVP